MKSIYILYFEQEDMGSSQSQQETKTIESTGHVNNNAVIQETEDVYSMEIVILLSILCALKILEIGIFLYSKYKQQMKKKYMSAARDNL